MQRIRAVAAWSKRCAGITALTIIYGGTLLLSDCLAWIRRLLRRPAPRPGTLVLSGTFHNPNWFFAHITPLIGAGFDRVIVVADGHIGAIDGIEVVAPPNWLSRVCSRAGAKFLMLILTCIRSRPALVMGYHIFPAAISALIAARACGAMAGFQVTSGPLELEGGGWHAENRLLISLGRPSKSIEFLAHALTRRFDLVVVRGSAARQYVEDQCRYTGTVVVVTGSVAAVTPAATANDRDIDILFVGRLAEYKRPDRFIRAMHQIAGALPNVRAVAAGDGPDRVELEQLIESLGLSANVELLGLRDDVPDLMRRSRVLLQTSRWEGVSIAVLESLMHGLVPVVSDVGDLRDVVRDDVTGFVVEPDDIEAYARHCIGILTDPDRWAALSRSNHEFAMRRCSTAAVRAEWNTVFRTIQAIRPLPA